VCVCIHTHTHIYLHVCTHTLKNDDKCLPWTFLQVSWCKNEVRNRYRILKTTTVQWVNWRERENDNIWYSAFLWKVRNFNTFVFQENMFLNKNSGILRVSNFWTSHIFCVMLIDDHFLKNKMLNTSSCQTNCFFVIFPKLADSFSKQIAVLSVKGPRLQEKVHILISHRQILYWKWSDGVLSRAEAWCQVTLLLASSHYCNIPSLPLSLSHNLSLSVFLRAFCLGQWYVNSQPSGEERCFYFSFK
jgi:hypothetical protein